jgi:hypothetical protein
MEKQILKFYPWTFPEGLFCNVYLYKRDLIQIDTSFSYRIDNMYINHRIIVDTKLQIIFEGKINYLQNSFNQIYGNKFDNVELAMKSVDEFILKINKLEMFI